MNTHIIKNNLKAKEYNPRQKNLSQP